MKYDESRVPLPRMYPTLELTELKLRLLETAYGGLERESPYHDPIHVTWWRKDDPPEKTSFWNPPK